MGVVERIMTHAERLTSTERKIAEVLAAEPQTIAFGTVAQVAQRAGTSGPSVVRLAVKLGYEGFVDLQADVQAELARQLGPARDRIRQRPPTDLLARVEAAEQDNVLWTLHAITPEALEGTVGRLSDRRHRAWILAGEVTAPISAVLASQIAQLRDGVTRLAGSEVAVSRGLAGLEPGDTLVAIDIRRYERSLVSMVRWACEQGATLIAITDSPLSPLVAGATHTFFISAQGVGPFDSMTGAMALANVLVTGVAARLRQSAPARLDAIEAAWSAAGALVAEPGGTSPLVGMERLTSVNGSEGPDGAEPSDRFEAGRSDHTT
jgi:DNA-binding MurR/RpiR family transcriptional regulator